MSLEPRLVFLPRPGGAHIAYTIWGSGLPLVRPPAWLSHQSHFGASPGERDFALDLAKLANPWLEIHYDKQGTGLSGHERSDFSLAGMVDELESLIDHLQLPRVALLCNSVAAMVGITYAVRHPERISRLLFINPVINGASVNMPRFIAAVTALAQLAPDERDIAVDAFAHLFAPIDAAEPLLAFGAALRAEARPSMALALWSAYACSDVTLLLPQLSAPALVLHSRTNSVVHFATAVEVATRIPGARLIPMDGSEHLFSGCSDARVRRSILDFLAEQTSTSNGFHVGTPNSRPVSLTRQQLHVLQLIAAGKSSRAIAQDLVLSERTVQRHIGNVYAKLGIHNRAEATAIALHLTHA